MVTTAIPRCEGPGCPRLRPGHWRFLKTVIKSHNIKFTILTIFRCAVQWQQVHSFTQLCSRPPRTLSPSQSDTVSPLNASFPSPSPCPSAAPATSVPLSLSTHLTVPGPLWDGTMQHWSFCDWLISPGVRVTHEVAGVRVLSR